MDSGDSAVGFFGVIVLAGAIVMAKRIRRSEFEQACRRTAERMGGSCSAVPGDPKLQFLIEGFPAVIDFQRTHPSHTRLRVELGRRPGSTADMDLRVAPALHALCGARVQGIAVDLSGDFLDLRVLRRLETEGELVALAEAGASAIRHLYLLDSRGVRWVEGPSGGQIPCPVCGSTLTDSVVRCEECNLPHHLECWKYAGRCSTYACKGKRFVA